MAMTRKDFRQLAVKMATINNAMRKEGMNEGFIEKVSMEINDFCWNQNSRFSPSIFWNKVKELEKEQLVEAMNQSNLLVKIAT